MKQSFTQRLVLVLATVSVAILPAVQTASAAIIQTEAAIEMTERQDRIDRIDAVLARDAVQDVLVSMGVEPADANARVHALTAEELRLLDEKLAELPAGGAGVVEVVGIVAIVLIVLELLNVTNFFTEF